MARLLTIGRWAKRDGVTEVDGRDKSDEIAGYEAAPRAIEEGSAGARASGDEPDVEKALAGLGSRWAFDLNALKPYPAGIVFHSVIDACLALREALAALVWQLDRLPSLTPLVRGLGSGSSR